MKTLKTTIRTLLVCTILLATASLYTSCDKLTPKDTTETPKEEEEEPTPRIVKKPRIIISSKKAKQHYDLYTPRARRIEEEMQATGQDENFRATRSLYLSKKDLEHYLAYIEQISEEVDVEPTGLRFYFSVFPEDYKRPNGSTRDAKQQTLFFVPTLAKTENGKTKHLAYTIGGDHNNEVILVQDILDGKRVASQQGGTNNNIQQAGLLNFFTATAAFGDEKSTYGNSLGEWHDDE